MEKPMSIETNKAIVSRFYEQVYNRRNLGIIDEAVAEYIVNHNSKVRRLEDARLSIAALLARFPDLQVTLEDIIAEGDKVVLRGIDRFTHQPDGKPSSLTWIEIIRMENGKFVEAWIEADMRSFLE